MRAARMVFWQPIPGERLAIEEFLQVATAAALKLSQLAEVIKKDPEEELSDGMTPAALPEFLSGIGVSRAERSDIAVRLTAIPSETVRWVELTRARQTATLLQRLGLYLPGLLGGIP